MSKPYFKAINWNKLEDRIDKSAWARLNDILWEPGRIPLHEDRGTFTQLAPEEQELILNCLGQLALISTLQSRIGVAEEKKDVITPQETSVFNALEFLESINNKGYAAAIAEFKPAEAPDPIDWAEHDQYLQNNLQLLQGVYQNGTGMQKKAAAIITSIVLYHSAFFTPLYLYGQHKMVRLAELIKDAMRGTAFNGIYPGRKFRLAFKEMQPADQEKLQSWLKDFITKILANQEKDIKYLYQRKPDWIDDVIHYTHYTMNMALMNMSQKTIFPDTADTINPILSRWIVKSAGGIDFFFYSNEHAFTHYKHVN